MGRIRRLACLVAVACCAASTPAVADGAAPAALLVAAAKNGIVLVEPASGKIARLLVAGGRDPALSPDGRRLVFGIFDGANQQLWVSDIDGTHRQQLTTGSSFDNTPDWSPDGTSVAFCHATIVNHFQQQHIAVVNADGTGQREIPGIGAGCAPSWSPDSQLLAYTAGDGTHVTDLDGRYNELVLADGYNPDWSPDGGTIAVAAGGSSDSDVTVLDVSSRQHTTITEFEGYHRTWLEPVWSADGGSLYTGVLTESFPDSRGMTSSGYGIEHRAADGARDDAFWADQLESPSVGGGPAYLRDSLAPAPVAATATATINGIDIAASPQPEADAAGILVRYAVGDVPPATPSDGLPAGRSVDGRLSLRRLLADTTYAVSVFPLDWSGNAGPRTSLTARTPHEVATTLVMTGVPQFIFYGRTIDVRGRLVREDTGAPVVGAPISLFGHLRNQPDRLLATLTTDADGVVTSRRLPSGGSRYTLRYDGSDPLQSSTQNAITNVRTVVTARLSTASALRGRQATVLVQLRPVMPNTKVFVDQWVSNSSRRRFTAVTGATGRVTVRLDTARRGAFTVQASTYGDALRTYGDTGRVPFRVR